MNPYLKAVICFALVAIGIWAAAIPISELRLMNFGDITHQPQSWMPHLKSYLAQQLTGLVVCVLCVHSAHIVMKTA